MATGASRCVSLDLLAEIAGHVYCATERPLSCARKERIAIENVERPGKCLFVAVFPPLIRTTATSVTGRLLLFGDWAKDWGSLARQSGNLNPFQGLTTPGLFFGARRRRALPLGFLEVFAARLEACHHPEEDDGGNREPNQNSASAEELARWHRARVPEERNDEQNGEEHEHRREERIHD